MSESLQLIKYRSLLSDLGGLILETEKRVVSENPDPLFYNNVNFYVKMYLTAICTYLEAYLQDIAFSIADTFNNKIEDAKIPKNFLMWAISRSADLKEKDQDINYFSGKISKKDIADSISPNPFKTISTFRMLGIDLMNCEEFRNNKSQIGSIVGKRNGIIHHNDKASDLSFSDLRTHIQICQKYIHAIDTYINAKELG